jgi:hypothetical protein
MQGMDCRCETKSKLQPNQKSDNPIIKLFMNKQCCLEHPPAFDSNYCDQTLNKPNRHRPTHLLYNQTRWI